MINFILYTGLGFATVAGLGLAYGLIMNKAEEYTLVETKAVKPRDVNMAN